MTTRLTLLPLLAAAVAAADPLTNPTLPPVEKLEAPACGAVELVKEGRLQFCLVGDFAKEAAITGPKRGGQTLTIQRFGRDSRRRCATLLRDCFQKAVGEAPKILECGDPGVTNYPYAIVCGPCAVTAALGLDPDKLPPEGFEVRTFRLPDGVATNGPRAGVIIAGMDVRRALPRRPQIRGGRQKDRSFVGALPGCPRPRRRPLRLPRPPAAADARSSHALAKRHLDRLLRR